MHYEYQIILKRWLPILREYVQTKAKITPRVPVCFSVCFSIQIYKQEGRPLPLPLTGKEFVNAMQKVA